MEKLPNISSNQVALLRAQFNTGHILDDKFELATNDQQKVYTVFASLDEAEVLQRIFYRK